MSTPQKRKPQGGIRQIQSNFRNIRERRARGEDTSRLTRGLSGARSSLHKGKEYLKSAKDFAHRHRLTSKAKGGRTPGEQLGSELRKTANNAPLIGTRTRKKGIRNQ
jgi:hypothetical protein